MSCLFIDGHSRLTLHCLHLLQNCACVTISHCKNFKVCCRAKMQQASRRFRLLFYAKYQSVVAQNKYASFCSHNFQKSMTNEIKLPCKNNSSLIHCVSQIGKVCNKCASSMTKSLQNEDLPCLICSETLEEYLSKR